MQWADDGIILAQRKQGESGLILSLLTHHHGRQKGLIRHAARAKHREHYEAGALVTAEWNARLAAHLGSWRLETTDPIPAKLLDQPMLLACAGAATAMAEAVIPEHIPYPNLFETLRALLLALANDDGWAPLYLRWELNLLAELGYGLDLGKCAVTGATEDLAWVSPRTGRAVSTEAGADYADRLLLLPRLLGGTGNADPGRDLLDGLILTGHFLDRHLFAHRGGLPNLRGQFIDRLKRVLDEAQRASPASSASAPSENAD